MTTMTIGRGGEVTLPGDVRDRYGMSPETTVRLVETQAGLLLVPLTDEPMSEALALELAQWQVLGEVAHRAGDLRHIQRPEHCD